MAERFEDTLDECLEKMRQGDSMEQCLARHAERAAELEPLLRVAAAAQKASLAVEPRQEFKPKPSTMCSPCSMAAIGRSNLEDAASSRGRRGGRRRRSP